MVSCFVCEDEIIASSGFVLARDANREELPETKPRVLCWREIERYELLYVEKGISLQTYIEGLLKKE